jgi:hypothetical protein
MRRTVRSRIPLVRKADASVSWKHATPARMAKLRVVGYTPYHRIYASLYAIRNMLAPVRAHNFGLTSRLK